MRSILKNLCGRRLDLVAQVVREGRRPIGYSDGKVRLGKTLVLSGVVDVTEGKEVANHIWLDKDNELAEANLEEGDVIRFSAVIREYVKGTDSRDYALGNPRNVEIIKSAE